MPDSRSADHRPLARRARGTTASDRRALWRHGDLWQNTTQPLFLRDRINSAPPQAADAKRRVFFFPFQTRLSYRFLMRETVNFRGPGRRGPLNPGLPAASADSRWTLSLFSCRGTFFPDRLAGAFSACCRQLGLVAPPHLFSPVHIWDPARGTVELITKPGRPTPLLAGQSPSFLGLTAMFFFFFRCFPLAIAPFPLLRPRTFFKTLPQCQFELPPSLSR